MNTLGGSNEPVLREFPIVVAKDCAHWIRNDRKFTNEELSQGELSAALVMFDYVLEACAKEKCYDIPDKWNSYLNKLTVGKCLELKGYYTWQAKNKPIQWDINEIYHDYMRHWDSLWKVEQCKTTMKNPLKTKLSDFLKTEIEKGEAIQVKAFYSSQWLRGGTSRDHYLSAESYVKKLRSLMSNGNAKTDMKEELIKNNTAMMSILEFIFIACNKI